MVERFVAFAGTVSIDTGEDTVVGTGTAFAGRDREGAQVWVQPADAAPYRIGTVAAVDPRGIYDNLELPLLHAWNGAPVVDQPYELVDGPAIANGSTQAAIYARFAAFLEQNMGLVGNTADAIDYALVPNNSLFVDVVTRTIYQWRNGVLDVVKVVGDQWTPKGAWSGATTYALNDLVEHSGAVYVSNADGNLNHEPDDSPASDANWTYIPLPSGAGDTYTIAIGVNGKPAEGEILLRHAFEATVTFPEDLAGSQASADDAATGTAEFSVTKNGSEVGTVTFDADDAGIFDLSGGAVFTAGDILRVIAPETRDDTLADLSITLVGQR